MREFLHALREFVDQTIKHCAQSLGSPHISQMERQAGKKAAGQSMIEGDPRLGSHVAWRFPRLIGRLGD